MYKSVAGIQECDIRVFQFVHFLCVNICLTDVDIDCKYQIGFLVRTNRSR